MTWIASLSNGETVVEPPAVKGEISPWQQLKKRCADEGLHITMLRRTIFLDRRNVEFVGHKNADGYLAPNRAEYGVNTKRQRHYWGLGSVVGDNAFITWISDQGVISQEIVPAATMAPHCVMKR